MSAPVATRQRRFARGILLVLAPTVLLLLAGIWLNGRRVAWLAARQRQDLLAASDEQLLERSRQAADLGEPGIPLLAEALCSSRHAVAAAATEVLDEELQRWSALPPADTLARRVHLAESLAAQVNAADQAGRMRAMDVAERLLHWPADARAPAMRVTLACQQIFLARPTDDVGSRLR